MTAVLLWLVLWNGIGCERAVKPPSTRPVTGTVVSLSPAGTDLLLAIGLGDRLVGISTYDYGPAVRGRLPIVGDYERIDWERLAVLRPAAMVVQGQADRLPPGLHDRATELGIAVIDIQIDRLDDIPTAITKLGAALGVRSSAERAVADLNSALNVSDKPAGISVLLVTSDEAAAVAGRDTYLDDIATRAGLRNVVQAVGYVRLDAERGRQLRPEIVFLLLPGATPAAVQEATDKALRLYSAPGHRPRVVAITEEDALLPATNVVRLARQFAEAAGTLKASGTP